MAYAALLPLKQSLHALLSSGAISPFQTVQLLETAHDAVRSLQRVLEKSDDTAGSKRLDALEGRIRDEAHKFDDVLEFSDTILSSHGSIEEIESFIATVKKLEGEYVKELDTPSLSEEAAASTTDFSAKMVGLSHEFAEIKAEVLSRMRPDDFGVFSIVGAGGGTGRTGVAKQVFDDLCVANEEAFDCGGWARVGPNYGCKDILLSIVAQVDPAIHEFLVMEGEDEVAEYLHTTLMGRRYMIVLDDICSIEAWGSLKRSFPEQDNGSLILLTTTLMEVAQYAESFYIYEMASFLTVNYCWDILRSTFFGLEAELEEAGKKIAENCRGLRLVLVKVTLFLLITERTPELWNKLAADRESSVFMVADELSEIYKLKQVLSIVDDTSLSQLMLPLITLPTLNQNLKSQMFPNRLIPKMEIMTFFGMAGIGKTHLIKRVLEEQSILNHFDHYVWITLGLKYQSEEILVDILAQIFPHFNKMQIKADEKLTQDLCGQLSHKQCLIVLDDVWYEEPLHLLQKLFQNIKGKTLVTTRLAKVANLGKIHKMRLLNKEESWSLFCQKVFAEESFPPQLKKAGKMITENCEGLPLLILAVADLLSKVEKTREFWNKVAENKNYVFRRAHDETSKVLLPSYESLPHHLKACFLYMGVFSENYEISTSKLINFYIAEGFLEPNASLTIRDFAAKCLSDLVDRSLVMACKEGSNFGIKTCRLHSVFWYLSNSEAAKSKFFHALDKYADVYSDGMKGRRRLCIRNSTLLGIRETQDSIASLSTTRSLLCVGPPHQYPVPICLVAELLRVLDALTIRFYEFPVEVKMYIRLKYLALTYNGDLPCSISTLSSLRFLIVTQHLSIKSSEHSSYLPMGIWDMKGLEHLQVMGRDLPKPNHGAILPNLSTLSGVGVQTITMSVLEGIPNLKKLGIRIELAPDDNLVDSLHCLNRISCLQKLESLKCVVVNPELRSEAVPPPAPVTMFPACLKKLSLSGLGYPWEYMSIIGGLRNLQVLKLKCYAFAGAEWETDPYSFAALKFLLIEDTDLVRWKTKFRSFMKLECVSLKHCYELDLEEGPHHFPSLSFRLIEVVDCPYTVRRENEGFRRPTGAAEQLKHSIHSSWTSDRRLNQ
ncbi:putative late blight resistance protein homolog R1A-10 [Salvia miltiorrhiza]|uniref:putative late blight resistance protein homolog R1A-10 n=1 Tax=Salvia miltiorrhiza TaxID=226208 RepID=UPI0025AD1F53|nr:putative late blight resistance protein homolog R1A-10 [Salvia miltiorrhiza]